MPGLVNDTALESNTESIRSIVPLAVSYYYETMSSSSAWSNLSYKLLFCGRKTRKTWWKNPCSRIKVTVNSSDILQNKRFIHLSLLPRLNIYIMCSIISRLFSKYIAFCVCACVCIGMACLYTISCQPIIINIIPFISYLIFSLTLAAWINYPLQLFQVASTLLLSFYFRLFCKLLGKCEYK